MPVNKDLADNLVREYGPEEGERIYYAMANSKGRTGRIFRKGLRTAKRKGRVRAHFREGQRASARGRRRLRNE